jgi:hypothetical protein
MSERAEDKRLDAMLADLAEADLAIEPAPELLPRTLSAWDEQRTANALKSRRRWRWAVPAVAGIAAMIAGVLALPRPRPSPPVTRPGPESARSSVTAPEAAQTAPRLETGFSPPPARTITRAPQAVRSSPPTRGEAADFIAVGAGLEDSLAGPLQMARVRVSRTVLADLGLIGDAHRGGEPVQADVVFGEDGMARAIRIVTVSRRHP